MADLRQYLVLMILTDGEVHDFESTRQLLQASQHLPLSVMLIKVSNMQTGAQDAVYSKGDRVDKFEALARGVVGGAVYAAPGASAVGGVKEGQPKPRQNFCYMNFTKAMSDMDKADGVVAERTFKDIPKQFLQYIIAGDYVVTKTSDNKASNSKREIKKELEARKVKTKGLSHVVTAYLDGARQRFVSEALDVGYSGGIVEQVVSSGIQALDFNLLAENVAAKEKELEAQQEQPINLPTLASDREITTKPSKSGERGGRLELGLPPAEMQKLEPQVLRVFTKDKVPQQKFQEWNNKKNEAYMATQKMLANIEKEEMEFWERYLPASITSQYKNRKERVQNTETKEVEQRLDRADQIDPFLDSQKVKFDEKYGIKTVKGTRCLFCGSNDISIV